MKNLESNKTGQYQKAGAEVPPNESERMVPSDENGSSQGMKLGRRDKEQWKGAAPTEYWSRGGSLLVYPVTQVSRIAGRFFTS